MQGTQKTNTSEEQGTEHAENRKELFYKLEWNENDASRMDHSEACPFWILGRDDGFPW